MGRYRPVRVAGGPITARYRFIKKASWAGASKHTRFQIYIKSEKANMMSILIESLSLIEDMVYEVIILRIFFLFFMAIGKNKALLLIKDHTRNIRIYTERKKKRRVEFFPSYFNHFLRCLL